VDQKNSRDGTSSSRWALVPRGRGSCGRRSMELGVDVRIGPTSYDGRHTRASPIADRGIGGGGCQNTFPSSEILTAGGRYQSGDRRRFTGYYSQSSTFNICFI
jgi:hypothetical protein